MWIARGFTCLIIASRAKTFFLPRDRDSLNDFPTHWNIAVITSRQVGQKVNCAPHNRPSHSFPRAHFFKNTRRVFRAHRREENKIRNNVGVSQWRTHTHTHTYHRAPRFSNPLRIIYNPLKVLGSFPIEDNGGIFVLSWNLFGTIERRLRKFMLFSERPHVWLAALRLPFDHIQVIQTRSFRALFSHFFFSSSTSYKK